MGTSMPSRFPRFTSFKQEGRIHRMKTMNLVPFLIEDLTSSDTSGLAKCPSDGTFPENVRRSTRMMLKAVNITTTKAIIGTR